MYVSCKILVLCVAVIIHIYKLKVCVGINTESDHTKHGKLFRSRREILQSNVTHTHTHCIRTSLLLVRLYSVREIHATLIVLQLIPETSMNSSSSSSLHIRKIHLDLFAFKSKYHSTCRSFFFFFTCGLWCEVYVKTAIAFFISVYTMSMSFLLRFRIDRILT